MSTEAKEVMKQMNEAIVKPLHTPLPWTVGRFSLGSPNEPISKTSIIGSENIDGSRDIIAEVHMNHEACDTNAELIVRAVNSYEELCWALASIEAMAGECRDIAVCEDIEQAAKAALKKARG